MYIPIWYQKGVSDLNLLHLTGYGIKIKTNKLKTRSELSVTDGRDNYEESKSYKFSPRKIFYNLVISFQ